jgi:hypothetical protein
VFELTLTEVPKFPKFAVKTFGLSRRIIRPYKRIFRTIEREKELAEQDFLFKTVSTLYEEKMFKVVDGAYKQRKTHYQVEVQEIIELTPDMLQVFDDII